MDSGFFVRVNGFNRLSIFAIRFLKVFFFFGLEIEIGGTLYDTSPCTISLDDDDDFLLVLGERDGGERDGGDGDDTFLCFKLDFVFNWDVIFTSDIFLKRPVFL